VSDSPLFDETLSDLLASARKGVERAEARAADARAQARDQVVRSQHQAARAVAEAHARADLAVREERVRRAFLAQEVEAQVRQSLADVPPLPPLAGPVATEEVEPEAPPVPTMSELMRPSAGVTRFLDTLLGPSQA
jgi:hypothetical protein